MGEWKAIVSLTHQAEAGTIDCGEVRPQFREWTSLFSAEIFIMIVVYADESGTHDATGKETGSKTPLIAGFAAKKAVWDGFLIDWMAVLKSYDDVPYFHGRELRAAREAIVQNKQESKELLSNPYYQRKWNLKTIESFRVALTRVASKGGKISVIGGVNLGIFNSKRHLFPAEAEKEDPYKYCMYYFFREFHKKTAAKWGNYDDDIQFVFDQHPEKKWRDAIFDVFSEFQKQDKRMSDPIFEDKLKPAYVPLQAADLLAYHARRMVEKSVKKSLKLEPLDRILFRDALKHRDIYDTRKRKPV
jgi:Protein of unknown function (DUF3800)